ncbi:MAG: GIY-YIG nuclease family protein [Candidatus Shapirobacteria bacterium]|jgi:putative endonuclease
MSYFVYILRSINKDLYIGQTNNLEKRIHEHIDHLKKSAKFTKEHGDFKLIYSEEYQTRLESMRREKQLKGWSRKKKDALISGNLELLKQL